MRDFIPGNWEEEINVSDFIQINKKECVNIDFLVSSHELDMDDDYDVLSDEEKRFIYLAPFHRNLYNPEEMKKRIFINEEIYTKYIETGDRKKLKESKILTKASESERTSFFQPDISIVPLYGTRKVLNYLKQYIREMDKQFQTVEWIQRRISHHRSLNSLLKFEVFAKEQGVSVKKPAKNAEEAVQMIWVTALYAVYEDASIPFSLYSIFDLLDIFVERDMYLDRISENEVQRMVDELYVKLATLSELSNIDIPFDFNLTIGNERICKTVYRFVEAAKAYGEVQIPIQLIFNSNEFPEKLMSDFQKLFVAGHRFAVSQSFRKKADTSLTLTSSHTFFRNYEDVTIQLASFDLKKAFFTALNGGKEVATNTNFYQITQRVSQDNLTFEVAIEKFESFLKYYITLYSEYMNVYTYYYDQYHRLPFRQSLTTEYPHYLINMPYHNITPLLSILTAIKNDNYELRVDKSGYITDIIPKVDDEDEAIAELLNRIINTETDKILFYKNGNYNIVFFSGQPFFQTEDEYKLASFKPESFERTSFSGFKSLSGDEFLGFLNFFPQTTYTHIRLHKK